VFSDHSRIPECLRHTPISSAASRSSCCISALVRRVTPGSASNMRFNTSGPSRGYRDPFRLRCLSSLALVLPSRGVDSSPGRLRSGVVRSRSCIMSSIAPVKIFSRVRKLFTSRHRPAKQLTGVGLLVGGPPLRFLSSTVVAVDGRRPYHFRTDVTIQPSTPSLSLAFYFPARGCRPIGEIRAQGLARPSYHALVGGPALPRSRAPAPPGASFFPAGCRS